MIDPVSIFITINTILFTMKHFLLPHLICAVIPSPCTICDNRSAIYSWKIIRMREKYLSGSNVRNSPNRRSLLLDQNSRVGFLHGIDGVSAKQEEEQRQYYQNDPHVIPLQQYRGYHRRRHPRDQDGSQHAAGAIRVLNNSHYRYILFESPGFTPSNCETKARA